MPALTALFSPISLAPVDLMQVNGIDMTDSEPLRSAARLFGHLVTELEQSME